MKLKWFKCLWAAEGYLHIYIHIYIYIYIIYLFIYLFIYSYRDEGPGFKVPFRGQLNMLLLWKEAPKNIPKRANTSTSRGTLTEMPAQCLAVVCLRRLAPVRSLFHGMPPKP